MTTQPDAPAGEGKQEGTPEGTAEEAGTIAPQEQLYDLVIPPGTPQGIIRDIIVKYQVDLVERKEPLHFANMDGDERELLVFRGNLKVMQEVERYFYQRMKEYIGEA